MERGVYIIETFLVKDVAGNLKPVYTENMIRFTNVTTFQPCTNDVMISNHKNEFLDLDDLFVEANHYGPNKNPNLL